MGDIQKKNADRFIELDALRGLAAMSVLIHHYTYNYDYYFNILTKGKVYFKYGDWGVQVFFIISGYVIFMTLGKVKSVKEFAIARFSRLYPTYWVCMFLTLGFIYFFPVPNWGPFGVLIILKNLTMLQGFMKTPFVDQVYWSLCIELAFYAIMGLIFYFRKLKDIEIICSIWLLLCLANFLPDFYFRRYLITILILKYAPLFIAGIMFYKIKTGTSTIWNHLIVLSSLVIHCLIIYTDKMQDGIDYTPLALLIFAFLGFYFLMYKSASILRNEFLLFLGSISYPLYLLHNVIGFAIIYRVRMYTNNQFVYAIIPTVFSISLAFIVSKYIENPSFSFFKKKLHHLLKINK